jgi:hypothetical protein
MVGIIDRQSRVELVVAGCVIVDHLGARPRRAIVGGPRQPDSALAGRSDVHVGSSDDSAYLDTPVRSVQLA